MSFYYSSIVSIYTIQVIHFVDIAIVLFLGGVIFIQKKHTPNGTVLYFIGINNSMQIATLNYQYNPKDSFHSNSKTKFQHRHILTTVTNPKKKPKQRQSFLPNVSTNSNASLPPLKSTGKRPNSIRIKGSGILSSKFNDTSTYSFHQLSRSHSRQSDKSDIAGTRSRSVCI
jgi:hypothetical protein